MGCLSRPRGEDGFQRLSNPGLPILSSLDSKFNSGRSWVVSLGHEERTVSRDCRTLASPSSRVWIPSSTAAAHGLSLSATRRGRFPEIVEPWPPHPLESGFQVQQRPLMGCLSRPRGEDGFQRLSNPGLPILSSLDSKFNSGRSWVVSLGHEERTVSRDCRTL